MNKLGSLVILVVIGFSSNDALAQEGAAHLFDSQARYKAELAEAKETPVYEYETEVSNKECTATNCKIQGEIIRDATNKKYSEETVCTFQGTLTIHGSYGTQDCGDNVLSAYVSSEIKSDAWGNRNKYIILVTKLYAPGSEKAFSTDQVTLSSEVVYRNPGIKKPGEL